ncbi:MAG: hypothetical protein WC325_08435 [Candidatus Bathyarchaeia archaeon]|jgi:hypothetical protein
MDKPYVETARVEFTRCDYDYSDFDIVADSMFKNMPKTSLREKIK